MANNNGRIYIDTSGTTPVGVSIGDLQTVLNYDSSYLGEIIVNAGINPYAKYKPVRYSTPGTPTDAQRKVINYGITAPAASSSAADTKLTSWTYSRPRGKGGGQNGNDEWFRLLDFDGYNHSASSPIIGRGDVVVSQSGGSVSLATFPNIVGSMTLQDYGVLENYYLCVLMFGSVNGLPYIKTTSAPFGTSLSPNLTLEYSELTPFNNGTEYYLCLCNTMQTTLGQPPAGAAYLPLPYFLGDTLDNFIGTITKQTGYDISLSFDILYGGNSPAIASNFTDPAPPTPNYFSALPSPDPYGHIENESRYYFNASNNTSLKIRFKITGGTDTIYGNSIYARLSPSYYGSPTARLRAYIYKLVNGTPARINTSEALAQNTTYIACLYDDVLVLNSSNQRAGAVPATLTKIRPYLEIFDGGGENSVKIGGVTFGITNQSF